MAIPDESDSKTLFDSVYDSHHPVIYAYLFGQVQEEDAAADLLQDTFVRVWRHIAALRTIQKDRQLFWILSIARNLSRDHYRRYQARIRLEQIDCFSPTTRDGDPHAELLIKELQCSINTAIRSLPETLRLPLTLSVMAGLDSKKIAHILRRPAGTVRYQIGEARKRIALDIGLTEKEGRKEK